MAPFVSDLYDISGSQVQNEMTFPSNTLRKGMKFAPTSSQPLLSVPTTSRPLGTEKTRERETEGESGFGRVVRVEGEGEREGEGWGGVGDETGVDQR